MLTALFIKVDNVIKVNWIFQSFSHRLFSRLETEECWVRFYT